MRNHDFHVEHRVRDAHAVFVEMAARVADDPVLYLEFGVFEGHVTRLWSRLLTHPAAKLHGFDSFQGLPDSGWERRGFSPGDFTTEGRVPVIHDDRVSFHLGWFEDVLPRWELPNHERLVVIFDADLYSSTKFVLDYLSQHVQPGTLFYFDEFSQIDHEPRAFESFMSESGHRFTLIVADRTLSHAAFECVA
jgi:hypothetical protein